MGEFPSLTKSKTYRSRSATIERNLRLACAPSAAEPNYRKTVEMILEGTPISSGFATGTAVVYDFEIGPRIESPERDLAASDVKAEWDRLDDAMERSMRDLMVYDSQHSASAKPSEVRVATQAHWVLAREVADVVKSHIERELVNAEQAIDVVVNQWAQRLQRNQAYRYRQRELDVRDAGRRLTRYLAGSLPWKSAPLPPGSIIVAREIYPSEAIEFNTCGVVAMILERGGEFGHTAILARSLGIPAVTRVLHATSRIKPGTRILMDAEQGKVAVNPTEAEEQSYQARKAKFEACQVKESLQMEKECRVGNEIDVRLLANINSPEEVRGVLSHHFAGVGLLRTEFLFFDSPVRPTIEDHATAYQAMAEELNGLPLTVRILDTGGGKVPRFLLGNDLNTHNNPPQRGLRHLLDEEELLQHQLHALLYVAQSYDIRILFPMITSVNELERAVAMINGLVTEFQFPQVPPIGAMIETPAALFNLPEILDCVDFIAIGTNDLAQYMLAVDRSLAEVATEYSATHPSVLRAILEIIDIANRHSCPVCVCGEEAGRVEFACLLVGMGVRELSLGIDRRTAVCNALRSVQPSDLQTLSTRALECRTWAEVREVLDQFANTLLSESPSRTLDRQTAGDTQQC